MFSKKIPHRSLTVFLFASLLLTSCLLNPIHALQGDAVRPLTRQKPEAKTIQSQASTPSQGTKEKDSLRTSPSVSEKSAQTAAPQVSHPASPISQTDSVSAEKQDTFSLGKFFSASLDADHAQQIQQQINYFGSPLSVKTPFQVQLPHQALNLKLNDINSRMVTIWLVSNQGRVENLLDKEGNQPFEPATSAKLFTALLCYDVLHKRMDEKVTLREEDFENLDNARKAGFIEGETVSIRDLFYATLIKSGGEAAKALARLAYGSETKYIKRLDEAIQLMGLKNTVISNSTGISVEGDQTCTQDLAHVLALAASRPELAQIMSTASYRTSKSSEHPEGLVFQSILFDEIAERQEKNHPIYIGGGRPGFSPDQSFHATYFVPLGQKILVVVTSGANTDAIRYNDQVNLFQQILKKTHTVHLWKAREKLKTLPLKQASQSSLDLYAPNQDTAFQLPLLLNEKDLQIEYKLPEFLEAPIDQGHPIGSVQVLLNGKVLLNHSFIPEKTIGKLGFFSLANFFAAFYKKLAPLFILLFVLLSAAVLYGARKLEKKDQVRAQEEAQREEEARIAAEKAARRAEFEQRWEENQPFSYSTRMTHMPYSPQEENRRYYRNQELKKRYLERERRERLEEERLERESKARREAFRSAPRPKFPWELDPLPQTERPHSEQDSPRFETPEERLDTTRNSDNSPANPEQPSS